MLFPSYINSTFLFLYAIIPILYTFSFLKVRPEEEDDMFAKNHPGDLFLTFDGEKKIIESFHFFDETTTS